ncbi:uncharacterized protein [Spinacia oleracea]|uniref:Uncharacterized protein isoform X2 n=1 Tax=Spinacia oleracea TaxID=3562 RepID=A0ABM3RUM5_SPIOL|nr:uncharacterized protein LOC130472428 isoform X2 [Spinacia oleracea]
MNGQCEEVNQVNDGEEVNQVGDGEEVNQVGDGEKANQVGDGEEVTQLHPPIRVPAVSCWKMPPVFWWKVNTYGGPTSYGYCIRGLDGELGVLGVKWEPWLLGCSEVYMEAEAFYYGVQKALEFGYRNVIIECSCQPLLTKLRHREMIQELGPERARVTQILELVRKFDVFRFSYVELEGNSVAREISKYNPGRRREAVWSSDFPKVASDAASWDITCCLTNARDSLWKEIEEAAAAASSSRDQQMAESQMISGAPSTLSSTGDAPSPDQECVQSQMNPGTPSITSPDEDLP